MDKNNLIGLVLITLIVTGWLVWSSVNEKPVPTELEEKPDSTEEVVEKAAPPEIEETSVESKQDAMQVYGETFAPFATGDYEVITVETDKVIAKLSTKGGDIIEWKLKDYEKWDDVQTQLIREREGELYLSFLTYDNKKIDTRDLYFDIDNDKSYYRISGGKPLTLTATLEPEPGKKIIKKFTFHGDKYHVDNKIILQNMDKIIPNRGYNYIWSGGLAYQEKNSVDESSQAKAMVQMYGEVEDLDATEEEIQEKSATGVIDYVGIKIKYFGMAIIPQPYRDMDGTVDMAGRTLKFSKPKMKYNSTLETYDVSVRVPYRGGTQTQDFKVYIGPLEYDVVHAYGLEKMIYFGFEFGIRQIGEFFLRPIFTFIHDIIPNYGIVLIIFSILIKILLYPLSVQQMRSAAKMKLLAPEMQRIRDKYKDDNTKQQQEIMKMYSKYGVNPMGGCLPLVLQMPILFALWQFLRSSIQLRQESFILWIHDLSTPDVLFELPFKFIFIDHISGLALLMGITMFIQQKLTITDPRQKGMVYIMPVMFTLLFSNFPAGLNLYYFFFNIWSILQQVYINNFSKNKPTLEEMKKSPKKEGWFAKKMREAQEIAESQGKTAPGKYSDLNRNKAKQLPKKKRGGGKSSPTQGGKKKK